MKILGCTVSIVCAGFQIHMPLLSWDLVHRSCYQLNASIWLCNRHRKLNYLKTGLKNPCATNASYLYFIQSSLS